VSDDPEYDEAAGGAMERTEEPRVPQTQEEDAKATSRASALKLGSRGVMFSNVQEAVAYATACYNSRLLPSHIQGASQAFVIMDNGRALGLGSWAAWKLIYITKHGRIAIMSKGALAVAQASPRFENYDESIEFEGSDQMQARAVAKARGHRGVVKIFTLADARLAGLLVRPKNRRGDEYDGPWQAYLKDMLLARARDRALSIAFAAELAGIELETIAEDADRLDRGAAPVEVVGPAVQETAAAPRALPEASRDPLVAMLKGQASPDTSKAAAAVAAGSRKDRGGPPATVPPKAQVAAPPAAVAILQEAVEAINRHAIDESVEQAFPKPEPAPEPGKKVRKRYKVGDTYMGTRRVTEVDEDGRILEAVKLAPEQPPQEALTPPPCANRYETGGPGGRLTPALDCVIGGGESGPKATEKLDPTKPSWPAHKEPDGSWYCDAHNAYGCPLCGNPDEKPKRCPREHCGNPLNMFGDCDNCGWPKARFE
jgi:hypothetical protein